MHSYREKVGWKAFLNLGSEVPCKTPPSFATYYKPKSCAENRPVVDRGKFVNADDEQQLLSLGSTILGATQLQVCDFISKDRLNLMECKQKRNRRSEKMSWASTIIYK